VLVGGAARGGSGRSAGLHCGVSEDRLRALGWDDGFATAFAPFAERSVPGRVTLEYQKIYRVSTATGEGLGRVRGRLRHQADRRDCFPAVGDWVAMTPGRGPDDEGTIEALLPRRSRFSRKVAGETTEEQVVAANIDTVFLVSGLDGDYSLRRMERYLTTAWDGGARPVILLNKADLIDDIDAVVREVEGVASGAPIHAMSSKSGAGVEALHQYLRLGQTVAFLGSSGVGKSTLVNRLLGGERQRTADVRASDSKGRHTTTHRELLELPSGGLLIDTPGMREMQLWEGSLEDAFADIHALSSGCHFRDCRHGTEPRCAVAHAAEHGGLDPARLASFRQLQRELTAQARRQDELLMLQDKKKNKVIHKAMKQIKFRP
jgi:ribosome biogenesis GTPase / thiamine phosphate phosphatase